MIKIEGFFIMIFPCYVFSLFQDMKPNNLLLDERGVLKIGDFGLAKFFGSPNRVYTHQVVTRYDTFLLLISKSNSLSSSETVLAAGFPHVETRTVSHALSTKYSNKLADKLLHMDIYFAGESL